MSQPVVTCIPTYDAEPRCYLKSVSTGLYLVSRDDGTISTSSTCTSDAWWRLGNDNHAIIWHRDKRSLVYGLNWQDVVLSDGSEQGDLLMKLISPKPDAPSIVEIQCPAFQVGFACSRDGDVYVVPLEDERVHEECQWEMLASGELCFICCHLDHSRITWEGNKVGFASVHPMKLQTWSSNLSQHVERWRLAECGDGSVEVCSYDYKSYLALVDDHVTLTGSAANNSKRWSIIRNAIRGVQIKSSAQGLYLGKLEGQRIVSDQENATGDAFLWSLDPVHQCHFIVISKTNPTSRGFPLDIQVCSNGRALVAKPSNGTVRLPSGFNLSILEFCSSGVRIKQARSGEYLARSTSGQVLLTTHDSPFHWDIQPQFAGSNIMLGLIPWMLPAAVHQNAPKSWIGYTQAFERKFDMPPSLLRPFANWRCWPIDFPSEAKVDVGSTRIPVDTKVGIHFDHVTGDY